MRCSFVRCSRLNWKLNMRKAPRCSTPRSSTWSGARGIGGSGSPTLPQAARKTERKRDREIGRAGERESERTRERENERRFFSRSLALPFSRSPDLFLQNVSAEIFILHDICQHLAHIGGVYNLAFLFQIGAFERNLVEDFLQDRVQAARAYVFGGLVHLESEVGHFVNRVFGDFERYAFGLHQRLVLFDQGVLRLRQDSFEVI